MESRGKNAPIFREVQRLRQTWIWGLVIVAAGPVWYASVRQLLLGRPFGDRPVPDIVLALFWMLFGLGMPALLIFCKLVTEVRSDGLYVRYYPFHWRFRKFDFSGIVKSYVRDYRPIREYGGWGIRWGAMGRAYNMSGHRGVQLELASGERLLIGSQRPEELWQAIQAGVCGDVGARPRTA